jgi:hypothetical protein
MVCPERKALAGAYAAAVKEYRRIVSSRILRDGHAIFQKELAESDEARRECKRLRLLMIRHSEEHGC